MFKRNYDIKFYELNHKNQIKETVILNLLQDIAAVHAETLGFGYSFIQPLNLGWFLLKYHLKIHAWQKGIQNITIKTWPKKVDKLSCTRDFEVYACDGELLASVSSSWVLTDLTTRKIVQPQTVLNSFPTLNKNAMETTFKKIPPISKITRKKDIEIRFDDIDINGHVNNSTYLTWALEALDFEFRTKHSISELEIQYKKEIMSDNEVCALVEISEDNKTTLHSLKSKNEEDSEFCAIKINWKN